MALVGALSSSVLAAIVFACFLSTATSRIPAAPLHNASDTDFQALLCIKLHLSGNSGAMASWKNDSMVQYCSWPGVTCSKKHEARVIALVLESLSLHGEIPACIANLSFLRTIHLPNNQLNGHIPPELGHLHRLTYLNLSFNNFTGVIPNTFSSYSGLEVIDLSHNSLDGEIPEGLGTLSNLSVLYLANNQLSGNIPFSIGGSSLLNVVVLTNNTLTGGIPPLLANSSSLQFLDLTNNHLSGEIPFALFNSSSLFCINLGINSFVGSIPPISNISSPLEYLILSQNNLTGSIPLSIGNLSSLVWLFLAQNNFQGTIPSSLSRISHLQELDLTSNNLSGTIPDSLYNISTLTYLGIGANNIIGEIPHNIGYTLPLIETLILQGNKFHGPVPTSLASATNLRVINLRDNAFHGIVPSFGNLPNLIELNLGMNRLQAGDWSFLSSLTNCSQLVRLCLDINILKGILPSSIARLSKSLEVLLLSTNEIYGTIPQEIERLTNLTVLHMEDNMLSGNFPDSLGNLSNLFVLRLSQNKLSGQIPLSIGKLSQLSELYLQENNFSGAIPSALGRCKKLEALNLSCNSFDGSIPKEMVTLSSLSEWLDLSHNQLHGDIPIEIGGLINLELLNISNNRLSGQIPSTLGECVYLESLHMEGNLLGGSIPNSFNTLRGIIELDLSRNNLSSTIPEFIESFSSLKLLNLSYNDFEGHLPTRGIFQNANNVFIQGNNKLCSSFALLQLPICKSKELRQKHTFHILKIAGLSALSLVLFSCLILVLWMKKKKSKETYHPSCKELKKYTYSDLVNATNGFSPTNLVGSGKYGSVYKGIFEFEQHAVAIKVFKLDQLGAQKSFLDECEALRNTRHPNLLRVITACSTCDPTGLEIKALILEYMTNASLESWLYPETYKYGLTKPLSLGSRIVIVVDMASALDYLHNDCIPPMVHCDLKPSNVLLDDVMGARLGDFWLAKFLHTYSSSRINSSTSIGPRGSIGYIAPEYGFGSKVSTYGDVYSYGIVILEMLTGKRPTDKMFSDGLTLHKFVENAFPEKIGEILDPNIVPSFEDEDMDNNLDHENHSTTGMLSCVRHLAKIGLSCSKETPNDRPNMQDVYAEVVAIKEAFTALRA